MNILASAGAYPAAAQDTGGGGEKVVCYLIREIPDDATSSIEFAFALSLREQNRTGSDIGWSIVAADIRQAIDPHQCDRTWHTTSIDLTTPDGLWWVTHADADQPAISEFDMPPLIAGTADALGAHDDLIYSIRGNEGDHGINQVRLDYRFQLANNPEVEGEDDDDEGDIDDAPDGPVGMPGYDLNQDGASNGKDIGPFMSRCMSGCDFTLEQDVPCFIATLLGTSCEGVNADCNGNGQSDGSDVYLGLSNDCNGNGVPDECDIANESESDLNEDGLPDSCTPDCNANGIPDDLDVSNATSVDVDGNGIPDECDPDCNGNGIPDGLDISQAASRDCDQDGVPDECFADCNGNGIADSCDMDPSDPDGDGWVEPDCNGNLYPDACDMTLPPPFNSFDCNANGVPDSCDIALCEPGELWCQDCNDDGIPDACDISSGNSMDGDENGIPDECEMAQAQMSGGPGPSASSPLGGDDSGDAMAELIEWSIEQPWGSDSPECTSDQFQGFVDKCHELEIPVRDYGASE
jgi:hypothetical protein